jgi:drug/metabolite transporter (DMT)-like permease
MTLLQLLELLLLAAIWGASFLFMRIAAPVLGPVWLVEFRVLVAGLVLMPLLALDGKIAELRRCWQTLLILGIINSALPFTLLAFASVFLPAGLTAILNATAPLFGVVVAFFWLKESLSLWRGVGFVMGFVGVAVLIGWQDGTGMEMSPVPVLAALLASLLYAIGAPFARLKLGAVSPLTVTTGSLLGAALFLLPALPFTAPETSPSVYVLLIALALAVMSTAVAYIFYFRLIKSIGSSKALTVTYLVPLFAMVWAFIVLGEAITPAMIVGCGLILLGTAVANELFKTLRQKRPTSTGDIS